MTFDPTINLGTVIQLFSVLTVLITVYLKMVNRLVSLELRLQMFEDSIKDLKSEINSINNYLLQGKFQVRKD